MPPRRSGKSAVANKQDKTGPTSRAELKQNSKSNVSTYDPSTSDLEKKRLQVADDLFKVEQQIYDLETKYLEQSTSFGNAIRGYEGFLGGVGQVNKKVTIKPEDRIFSGSFASK